MPFQTLPDFFVFPDLLRAAPAPMEKGLAAFTRSLNAVDWLSFDEKMAPKNYLADAFTRLASFQEHSHWKGLHATNIHQVRDDLTSLQAPEAFLALMGEFILRDFYPRDMREPVSWKFDSSIFCVMAFTALSAQRGGDPPAERALCALAIAGINQRDRRAGELDMDAFPKALGEWLRPRQRSQILDHWVERHVSSSREFTPGQAWPSGIFLDKLLDAGWVSRNDFPEWIDQTLFDPKSRVSPEGTDPEAAAQMTLSFFKHMGPEAILNDRRLLRWTQAMDQLAQSPKDYLSLPWGPVAGHLRALIEQAALRRTIQSANDERDPASRSQQVDGHIARPPSRL